MNVIRDSALHWGDLHAHTIPFLPALWLCDHGEQGELRVLLLPLDSKGGYLCPIQS